MRIVYGHRELSEPIGPVVMTIGTFDGLHVGHRAIVEQVVERARKTGQRSLVYSFFPPPWRVLGRGRHPWLILTLKDKIDLLAGMGVDLLITEEFTPDLQVVEAEDFARDVLRERLGAQEIHVGYDFAFGKDRRGDVGFLRRFFADSSTEIRAHGAVRVDGEVVGCTRVRELVCDGDVEAAAVLLGRYHFVRGAVVRGRARGRTLGFPTANVAPETELLPPAGVYAVRMALPDGTERDGIANLGFRPTFEEQDFSIEVHLFDFDGDLYGARVTVDFVRRVRDERRFDGVDALRAQIQADIEAVRAALPLPPPRRAALTWDPKPA